MAKVYLAFRLAEFDIYNLQAFASKADRKNTFGKLTQLALKL